MKKNEKKRKEKKEKTKNVKKNENRRKIDEEREETIQMNVWEEKQFSFPLLFLFFVTSLHLIKIE